ncbi:MAG: LacI family DNA-binding transcriptional regulator [Planctomycetota bacterium]
MPITLKDIAERAKVSQAAVSIAMGSSGRISDETRKRILKIANDMGYRPNLLVHGIQKGRTMTVGVLMYLSDDAFNTRLFNGFHNNLAEAKYVPIVLMPCKAASVLDQMHSLIDRRVDGILIRPSAEAMWERHLNEALDRNVPVVSVDVETQGENRHVDFVGTDDVGGARMAAEKLLEAGHRSLGVLTTGSFPDGMYFRREGFEKRVAEQNGATCVSISEPWRVGIDGYEAAKKMLTLNPRPTAIFVTMDQLARGVYRAAKEMRLSIPDDLSVIGFADNPIATLLEPKLTTLHQRPEEIGARASKLLLQRIKEGDQHGERERILIKPDLAMRESIGPAPTNS